MSKYNSRKTTIDGFTFDSKDESECYKMLKDLKSKGIIYDFELQPVFELQEKFKKDGKTYKPITYIADFRVFIDEKESYIIDVKGMLTQVFSLKLKLFHYRYPNIELRLLCRSLKYGDEYGFIDYYKLQKIRRKNRRNKNE